MDFNYEEYEESEIKYNNLRFRFNPINHKMEIGLYLFIAEYNHNHHIEPIQKDIHKFLPVYERLLGKAVLPVECKRLYLWNRRKYFEQLEYNYLYVQTKTNQKGNANKNGNYTKTN